jgi:hypothetical protein
LVFEGDRALSFYDNFKFMQSRGALLVEDYGAFMRAEFEKLAESLQKKANRKLRVGIDISSMNRTMIANTVMALCQASRFFEGIEFYYMPANFREPDQDFPTIENIGAVIPEFSGQDVDTSLPVCIVMGVGYEYGLAVGLINRIEPARAICFAATGHDEQYVSAVRQANLNFEFGLPNIYVSEYNVLDARTGFKLVSDVVSGVIRGARAVLVPMGPKLFALICNLIALRFFGAVAVWRIVSEPGAIRDSFPDRRFVTAEIDMEEFHSVSKKARFLEDVP